MKRFLLFAGKYYYPCGGSWDFLSAHDTVDEAKAAFNEWRRKEPKEFEWCQVFDYVELKHAAVYWEGKWRTPEEITESYDIAGVSREPH